MYDVDDDLRHGSFATTEVNEYKIAAGDEMTLVVFTNKAYNQVNTMMAGFQSTGSVGALQFTVQLNGEVFLPVIGYYRIVGQTIPEAEVSLGILYDEKGFTDPLVTIGITNRRVFVYTGGTATVVPIETEAVTLIEVLTTAGGIPEKAKAHRLMLIRKIDGHRQVQMVDMSDEQALTNGEIIIQPNDIIYVEPVRPFTVALSQVTTYIAILSGLVTTYLAYLALTKQ